MTNKPLTQEQLNASWMISVDRGLISTMDEWLQQGADINTQNSSGETALIRATEMCRYQVVAFLLSKGASPHFKDGYGNTPLHFMCSWRFDTGCTKLLLEAGANLEEKNDDNETAFCVFLKEALENRVPDYGLIELCEYGADVFAKMPDGNTCADVIISNSHVLSEELVDHIRVKMAKRDKEAITSSLPSTKSQPARTTKL